MTRRHHSSLVSKILNNAGIAIRESLQGTNKSTRTRKKEYIRFVYKGNYYRRPIASLKAKPKPPEIPKIPPAGPTVVPKPFKTVQPKADSPEAIVAAANNSSQQTWSWRSWFKLNAPLLILNFGSLCTLLGFTCTDVLELRALSMTGSTTFVIYQYLQPPPTRWPAIIWSCLFASVNGVKIASILNERKGAVVLSLREEEIFHEHFEPHGVTPKQFEKVMRKAKTKFIKKGDILSRQGEQVSSLKLVVRGYTRANVLGRHLTAIGSAPGNRVKNPGGDSGAWVGEMAFLQSVWDRDHAPGSAIQKKSSKPKLPIIGKFKKEDEGDLVRKEGTKSDAPLRGDSFKYCAMSTIVAAEDIEVLEWSFEDMEKVMKSSLDMQGALTRAMTAAIVGKVVNFMVSRTSAMPTWATWLDNWRHASPRSMPEGFLSRSDVREEGATPAVQNLELSEFRQKLQSATAALIKNPDT